MTDPEGYTTKWNSYDANGNPASVDQPVGDGSAWARTTYTYDGRGNVLTEAAQVDAEVDAEEARLRQETVRWYASWFHNMAIGIDDVDMERLRIAMTLPLDLISTPVPGAFTALRWCRERGLRVVLVTNTLSRGDDEVWEDWRRFGLADAIDGVVSSHTVGWQKPHRRIFERALEISGTRAAETVMVGDRLDTDVIGAKRLGMRAVLRRTPHAQSSVDVRPDAEIDDLTTLPAQIERWLARG